MSDTPHRPSQAEGDREQIEADLGDQSNSQQGSESDSQGQGYIADPGKPSQAEGERSTEDSGSSDS